MIDQLTILLNTHSSCSDVWPMFFGRLANFWPGHPPVIMSVNDDCNDEPGLCCSKNWAFVGNATSGVTLPDNLRIYRYESADKFGQQYLQGLSHVQTDYVLPVLEDMILMGPVDAAAIEDGIAQTSELRLTTVTTGKEIGRAGRWRHCTDVFTMQPTIHKTSDLLRSIIDHRHCKTAREWEDSMRDAGPRFCLDPNSCGPQRGRTHFDSIVFPAMCTAINKERWNREYEKELTPLLSKCGIDPTLRGWK